MKFRGDVRFAMKRGLDPFRSKVPPLQVDLLDLTEELHTPE